MFLLSIWKFHTCFDHRNLSFHSSQIHPYPSGTEFSFVFLPFSFIPSFLSSFLLSFFLIPHMELNLCCPTTLGNGTCPTLYWDHTIEENWISLSWQSLNTSIFSACGGASCPPLLRAWKDGLWLSLPMSYECY